MSWHLLAAIFEEHRARTGHDVFGPYDGLHDWQTFLKCTICPSLKAEREALEKKETPAPSPETAQEKTNGNV